MIVFNVVFMILFLFVGLFTLYKLLIDDKKISNKEWFSQKQYKIIIFLIFFVGIFIRIYKFGIIPDGFNQDGAMAVVDGISLAKYGTDRYGMYMPVHLTAWGYGQMSSLLSYMIAFFVKIFGFSIIVARLPILVMSILSFVCIYLFVKDVFGENMALITSFMVAINPWHILQSRWVVDCNLFPHFLIIGVYLLYKGLSKKRYLWLSMIMFGLSMYCYGISIYTVPLLLLVMCIYLLCVKKINWKDVIVAFLVYMLVAWPFILTMAINYFKIDTIKTPLFTIPFFESSTRSADILFFSDNILYQLGINLKCFIHIVLLQIKDLPWNDIDGFGTIYKFSLPFFMTGICVFFKKYRKSVGAVLCFIFLLIGLWCGIVTNEVNVNRINMIFIPVVIMTSIGIYASVEYLKRFKWGIIFVYIVAFLVFSYTYFNSYSKSIEQVFFKDFKEAVSSLKNSNSDKFYITTDVQYKDSYDVAEILTLFYLEIDSKYYRGLVLEDGVSFKDKYILKSMDKVFVDSKENALYVITENDLKYFDDKEFNFKQFGTYYVVSVK